MNDQEKLNQEKIEEVNEVNEQITIKKNPIKEFFKPFLVVCKKLFDWTRRAIFGGSRTLYSDDPTMVEKLESPGKMAVKSFFRKKLQVTALIVLVSMFIFVFVGPLFIKIDYSADATQMNMNPTLALRSVPKGLKNNIKSISSYGVFSVGVSNDNDLYVWGSSKDPISGLDFKNLPDELVGKKVAFASAGKDHAIAITTEGKVVGWGSNSLAQYGNLGIEDSSKVYEPDELINGTIDAIKVGEGVAATPHYSEDYYVTMRRYEVIKVITYVVYEIATIVPLVLAIFIRIDKALSKNNKIVVIVATVFASLMGSCWALNAVDRLFDVRSLTRGNTQILPVNFVIVLLMLIITVVVTSMKKNQIKFKWFIAIFVMLIILNVPFISIKWNSLTEIHLPIMSNAYVHYLSEFEITDSEVAEINNDIKIIESMRVYSEKNMPI